MLPPMNRTASDYRVQAAHLREFLETVHDDRLRNELFVVALRFDRLAEEQAKIEAAKRPLARPSAGAVSA